MRILIVLFFSLPYLDAFTQKNDNVWLMGYGADMNPNNNFCFNIIRFDSGNPEIEIRDDIEVDIEQLVAPYCNHEGELVAYFNGTGVYNGQHQLMENGAGMNDFTPYNNAPLSSVMLDLPGSNQKKLVLISSRSEFIWEPVNDAATDKNYYSIIDLEANNGNGSLIQKLQILVDDTLTFGKINAVRHGNGRDWWVLINEVNSNHFYTVLIDPDGPRIFNKQSVGEKIVTSLGQATFSPNGALFATVGGVTDTESYLDLYNFDRCTGQLSNHRRHKWTDENTGFGACFSPNNRYLYVAAKYRIFQYDLWAADWIASRTTVAYFDGFASPLPAFFFSAQLAPNNKIYISTSNGNDYLHIIHQPDQAGFNCNVEQHGLFLGCYHYLTVPNYPHFRLFDSPGSPCDTLGINGPIANVNQPVLPVKSLLEIKPNPVTDGRIWVNLTHQDTYLTQLQLFSAAGTLIQENNALPPVPGAIEWNLSPLPAGTYYIEATDSKGNRYPQVLQIR